MKEGVWKKFKLSITVTLVIVMGGIYLFYTSGNQPPQGYVNVYDWYGMLSKDILNQFEKETGIRVRYDVYESNDILATKLFTGSSGYDVVFPSATPYLHQLIVAGAFEPLDHQVLGINLKEVLDISLIEQFSDTDVDMAYFIPYYWGTIGIVYNVDKVAGLLPKGTPLDTWALLFDPSFAKLLAPGGISLLEEAIDVIPSCALFLGDDVKTHDLQKLTPAINMVHQVRPWIKRISAARLISDLIMEEICIAHAWSSEAQQAIEEAKEQGINLRYIIPKEGALVWIDGIAIAKNAPHQSNAYQFIRFLLRPEIAAQITQSRMIAGFLTKMKDYLSLETLENPCIYPPKDVCKKLSIYPNPITTAHQTFETKLLEIWAAIRFLQHS